MQLNSSDSFRLVTVLEDAVDKLDILAAMAPDISDLEGEVSQLVSDEISRIIEEQRRLQARYEELIMQRSQLKNVTNKIKFKEIQTELEEVATGLRYATKVLCRNLKENPDVAQNLQKIQIEREKLQNLFRSIITELRSSNSFKTLIEALEKEKKHNEQIKVTTTKVKSNIAEIKRLNEEILDFSEERKREDASLNDIIQKLRDDLHDVRQRIAVDVKYQKKESKAHVEASKRVYSQKEKSKATNITKLQKRVESEKHVHEITSAFLERKHEELQQRTEYWDNKYEQDMEEKVRQLEALKSKKTSDLMKLNDLRQKFKEVQELFMKEKRLSEAKAYAKEMLQKRTAAAKKIQSVWRKYRKRKQAVEKLKKLRRQKKKGQKKGRGTSPKR